MKKVIFITLILTGLVSQNKLIAQEKTIEFKDGRKASFELLAQNSQTPLTYVILPRANYLTFFDGGYFALGLDFRYSVSNNLELAGYFDRAITGETSEYDEDAPMPMRAQAKAFYTLFEFTKEKEGVLTLGKERKSDNSSVTYNLVMPMVLTRRIEAYGGLGYIQRPINYTQINTASSDDNRVSRIYNTNLELGLTFRGSRRLLYSLDNILTGQYVDGRIIAKVIVPIIRNDYGFSNAYESNENIPLPDNFFKDDYRSMGFSFEINVAATVPGFGKNILQNYSIEIGALPHISGFSSFFNLGYAVGFGPNNSRDYIG